MQPFKLVLSRSGARLKRRRSDTPLTLEDKVRLLSMVDVFESLVREELEDVARRACDTHLERGEVMRKPQEEGAEELYVLKEGRVQLFVETPGGGEVTLSVVEGGSIFGELVLGGRRSAEVSARALSPSLVCSLETEVVERLIESNPRVGIATVRLLSERLREAEVRLAELAYQQVSSRLANLILRLGASEGIMGREGIRIPTPYTHRQLGSMISAKREAVSRAMTELREGGPWRWWAVASISGTTKLWSGKPRHARRWEAHPAKQYGGPGSHYRTGAKRSREHQLGGQRRRGC